MHVDLLHHVLTGGDAAGDQLFGIENISSTKFGDFLQGDSGNNVIFGNDGNDNIYGGGGNDVLVGGPGNDFLYDVGTAPGGVVIFRPGLGIDTVAGNGNDILAYSDSSAAVVIDLSRTIVPGGTGGAAAGDKFAGILSAYGSGFNDTLISSTVGHADMRGLEGDDKITLLGASDTAHGDAGNDTIYLKGSNQLGAGGTGNDVIDASAATSSARLEGGAGNDTLKGSLKHTDYFVLELLSGSDTIFNFGNSGVNTDKLVVNGAAFGIGTALDASEFLVIGHGAIAGTGAGPEIIYDSLLHNVWYAAHGATAAPVLLAHLDNAHPLTSADFLIV